MARTALVTGGSRGIGAAIAIALKNAGYRVATNYFGDDEAANRFSGETGIKTYRWSVTDYEACKAGVAQVEADLGPVEVLVNNAGITRDAMFHKMTLQQWKEVIDTNLNGVFNMTHQVWSGMRDRKFGRIITISSINGQKGQAGQANYSASKAGDIGFTKALAQEGARFGITVNSICPGYIGTEMVRAIRREGAQRTHHSSDPGRPPRGTRGGGALRAVPRIGRCRFHHRLDHFGQWRPVLRLRSIGALHAIAADRTASERPICRACGQSRVRISASRA
jgi:Dehydrogenases with different specificities (related to short-chain alcohol dehydrogenases)